MAKSKRKAAKGKPVTSHPLFPAVVALWFGALFGLGSLAIRPGLIEGLVLKSGLDLIIPAAAPPLGNTARILIALTMASTGALIGGLLARRLTRPKAEVGGRAHGPRAANEPVAEAPMRRPISAHDELGASLDSPAEGLDLPGGRRRALAVEDEERPFPPHEFAPLPGGEPPVFSVGEALDAPLDSGALPPPAPAPAPAAAALPPADRRRPADLGMTDLARRLQESMARRRAAREAAEAGTVAPRAESPLEVAAPLNLVPPRLLAISDAPAAISDRPAFEPAVSDETEVADDTGVQTEDGFGSLLSIIPAANTAAATSSRAVDPGEAEAALRAALANLQRLSGAA